MKGSFADILEKFAVDRPLHPYESAFWQVSSDELNVTCSAEIRVNAYADAIEAEIQWMPMNETGDVTRTEQVLWCEVKPQTQGLWSIIGAKFRGQDYMNSVYDWDEKLCRFFRAVVRSLKQDKVPDLEELEKTEMSDSGVFGDKRGDGSGRNVKIKTNQLLYDLKAPGGRGF